MTGENGATSCLEVHPLCCSLTFTSAVFVSDAASYQISKVSPNIMYIIRVNVLSFLADVEANDDDDEPMSGGGIEK